MYLLTYSIASITAFAAYMMVAEPSGDGTFSAFNGLGKKQPFVAAIMTMSMFSLAGIPPLAGFFGKYFLFTSVIGSYPWLVVLAVINSAVSIYYYFKVVVAMYFTKEENEYEIITPDNVRWILLAGVAILAVLSVFPGQVFGLLK
jgi:NADH-quinone oxidoreductase subunit N